MAAAAKISPPAEPRSLLSSSVDSTPNVNGSIREQLGAEEFQTAWDEGTALSMAEVAAAISLDLAPAEPS